MVSADQEKELSPEEAEAELNLQEQEVLQPTTPASEGKEKNRRVFISAGTISKNIGTNQISR